MRKQICAVLLALAAALIAVGGAGAGNSDGPSNGGFETGKFKPWNPEAGAAGVWSVYDSSSSTPFPFPAPAEGNFAVWAAQFSPTVMTLTQKFRLKQSKPAFLSFWLGYEMDFLCPICGPPIGPTGSTAPSTFAPKIPICLPDAPKGQDDLDLTCDQELRVDVLKANADPGTTDGHDILATLFTSDLVGPSLGWTYLTYDLTPFAGRNIKLRFLISASVGPIFATIDGVKLSHTAIP